MGVKGLTTYLKDNRRTLCYILERNTEDASQAIDVVVDGWSLIYWVYNNAGEPWVYGGEGAALARHVDSVVSAWLKVGLRPTVVFDGPAPPGKYPTLVARMHNNCVKPANLFFRTSPAARAAPRALAETRIAPPLGYHAVLAALLARGGTVAVEFADGEADPHIVALAAHLGAFVLACDSDFIVLHCEGYKGYIPLDEMTWCASSPDDHHPADAAAAAANDNDDDGAFQTVTRKKHKGKHKPHEARIALGNGPLPPVHEPLSLLLAVYEPATFAKHVALPPALLPLVGALVGNDYAAPDLFRPAEAASQRVARGAATLAAVLRDAQSGDARTVRRVMRGQGRVLDVIGTTVERLLLARDPARPPAGGEVAALTETVVQSTLQYALDDGTAEGAEGGDARVRTLYMRAFRRGVVHPRLFAAYVHGACMPALFLEDPDRQSCALSIGRPVRAVIWRIFGEGGGIPERPCARDASPGEDRDGDGDGDEDEDEDEDELVDVAEETSDDNGPCDDDDDDPLAALRGKLQRLSFSGAGAGAEAVDLVRPEPEPRTPPSHDGEAARRPKVLTEYVRRGARMVGEELEVAGREGDAEPVQLRPVGDRLEVFLGALGSDTPGVRGIAARAGERGGDLLLVVALRWVVQTLHARAEAAEDGHRRWERDKERWTRAEAQAFLASAVDTAEGVETPAIEARAVQLTAQALAALEACGWLAQALLLVGLPGDDGDQPLPVMLGQAETMFSGRRFHSALMRPGHCSDSHFERLWDATAEGLGGAFRDERGRGGKERKEKKVASHHTESGARSVQGVGMFGPLAGLDVP